MTRSPKMTGTRSRRNCGREPDIATASDTSPERSALSLSLFPQSPCPPANIPTCQHTLHSINSEPTPCLRNDAEIKPILSTLSFRVLISASSLLPSAPYCSPIFSITSILISKIERILYFIHSDILSGYLQKQFLEILL